MFKLLKTIFTDLPQRTKLSKMKFGIFLSYFSFYIQKSSGGEMPSFPYLACTHEWTTVQAVRRI
jgi:hypothetical protein